MRSILFCLFLAFPCSVHAQIVISEVMWVGTEVSTADEWLEIVNISDSSVSLAGWSITKRASDGGMVPMVVFEEDVELEPSQYYLISNYPEDSSALSVQPDLITSSVSLTNTKLFLQILDADGEIVDTVDDGIGEPFAGGKDPFSIMKRIDLHASGEEKQNWESIPLVPVQTSSSSSSFSSSSSVSLSSASSSSQSSLPSVIISEILSRPKDPDDYEWIEIANLGNTDIDIQKWEIKVGSRSYEIEPRNEDGYTLKPNEHTLFFRYQTGLNIPSDDGHIFLYSNEILIDDLPYSRTGEEVSFGRGEDGSRALFCVPSPREKNVKRAIEPFITEQSGRSTDYTKVTLNLKADVKQGSLNNAECFWDFKDGTSSESCNPPSHSWDNIGVYKVELTIKTMCGDEIKKTKEVVVLQKKKKTSASFMSQVFFSSSSSSSSLSSFSSASVASSVLSSSTSSLITHIIEQKMYTISQSSISSTLPTYSLPTRYNNVSLDRQSSSLFTIPEEYLALNTLSHQQLKQQEPASSDGFPWVLLFTQSAVFIGFAGWKYL